MKQFSRPSIFLIIFENGVNTDLKSISLKVEKSEIIIFNKESNK